MLVDEVKAETLRLVSGYRGAPDKHREILIKQAVDSPHRARAQLQGWIDRYDATHGSGAAQTLMSACLLEVGGPTLAEINSDLALLEQSAQALVDRRNNDGWTWTQIASAIESSITKEDVVEFEYGRLPIPQGYLTIWGEPH
jgi:hypothetical protein